MTNEFGVFFLLAAQTSPTPQMQRPEYTSPKTFNKNEIHRFSCRSRTLFVGTHLFKVAGMPVYGGLSGRLPRFHQTDQRVVFWVCLLAGLLLMPLLAGFLAK